jgi:hypothetical protein
VRLSDHKITSRIYGGFGVLVVLGTAVTGFSLWQLARVGGQIGRLVAVADDNARAIEVGERIQSLRHLGLKFKTKQDSLGWSTYGRISTGRHRTLDLP